MARFPRRTAAILALAAVALAGVSTAHARAESSIPLTVLTIPPSYTDVSTLQIVGYEPMPPR